MKFLRVMVATWIVFALASGVLAAHAALAASVAAGLYANDQGSPVFALIDGAQKQVDIEIYSMKDPDFRSTVRAALKRGIRVRLIKDVNTYSEKCAVFASPSGGKAPVKTAPIGLVSAAEVAECSDMQALVREIRAANGMAVPYAMSELCGLKGRDCFQHGKMVIVDGARALLSSGNFDSTSFCNAKQDPEKCNRDYSVVINDRALVTTLQTVFNFDLAGKAYDLAAIVAPVAQKLTISPLALGPLVQFIGSAKTSLQIQNQYLNQPELNAAIIAAAKRGVKVSVTVASACAYGASEVQPERITPIYTAFDAAGVSSVMFDRQAKINGRPGYLHAKAIVVDGKRAWVGSVNGSDKAVKENREFGIFFDQPSWVAKLEQIMTADHQDPRNETWQQSLQCLKDQ